MKTIALLLSILIISQSINAARTCKDYITDEWPDARYTVADLSGDNVVTDNKTGLMWKQCTQGLTGSTCTGGVLTPHTWKGALDLASAVNSTGYAGFIDWRVPNIEELRSIAAINCFNPAINETVFPNTPSDWFWSSSPFAFNPSNAWKVFFYYGNGNYFSRGNDYRVRLVRSGQ